MKHFTCNFTAITFNSFTEDTLASDTRTRDTLASDTTTRDTLGSDTKTGDILRHFTCSVTAIAFNSFTKDTLASDTKTRDTLASVTTTRDTLASDTNTGDIKWSYFGTRHYYVTRTGDFPWTVSDCVLIIAFSHFVHLASRILLPLPPPFLLQQFARHPPLLQKTTKMLFLDFASSSASSSY